MRTSSAANLLGALMVKYISFRKVDIDWHTLYVCFKYRVKISGVDILKYFSYFSKKKGFDMSWKLSS